LLQMVRCTMGIASTVWLGDGQQLGPMEMVTLSILSPAFVDYDYLLALYLN
jgi:hypothetical protein